MVALRFTLIAILTMIFVPWPKVPARWLIGIGLGMGTMQFALLYVAMIGYGPWNALLAVTPTATPLARRRRTAAGMPVAQARSLVGSARAARRRS
jgi:hypothetical protein